MHPSSRLLITYLVVQVRSSYCYRHQLPSNLVVDGFFRFKLYG